jgi:putative NIF3 family GTP cyclohydrolase 1 type 2
MQMPANLRRLCCAVSVVAVLAGTSAAQSITAADAIQRIVKHYASSPPPNTVDTVKAGDASVVVTGIATTFLDTMDVLREANRRGANLVITHEPTFYNHLDEVTFFADDPVYREKLAFVEQHHMVVFRLHDVIHTPSPDPVATALIQQLGWQSYMKSSNPFLLTIPKTTLLELSRALSKQLDAKALRVVGDPSMEVSRIAIMPGAAGLQRQVKLLRRDDVEVLLAGESAEWEGVEYARDAGLQGRHKGLVLLGHEVSEEAGMKVCAEELRPLFPGLAVIHIPATQPLWSPANLPASSAGKK